MFNFIATKMKERKFDKDFYHTIHHFRFNAWAFLYFDKALYGTSKNTHTVYTRFLSETKNKAFEIEEICKNNKAATKFFANELSSETILMKNINKNYTKNKISFENDVIKETVFELHESFIKALKNYAESCTYTLKEELEISRLLRVRREEIISSFNLNNREG